MDKKERNKLLDEIHEKEFQEFRSNLPFDEKYFPKLFDFIDQKLSNTNCTNDFKFTKIFCIKNKLAFEELTVWLQNEDNGYHCDCEVLNLEDAFQYLTPKKKIVLKKKEWTTRKLTSLQTDFGFHINKVESPWHLKEVSKKDDVQYVFQLGNKEGHMVSFLDSSNVNQFYDDDFLKNDFINTTELEYDLDFIIARDCYKNFDWVSIKTIRWNTILMYFKPKQNHNWVLKLQTEVARQKGDLNEFYKILNNIL